MIAVYGGSFDPVTNAHISIGTQLIQKYNMEKVIFLPVGNNYTDKNVTNAQHRINMLNLCINNCPYMELSTIEMESKILLRTIDTLRILKKQYKDKELAFIIGTDNLKDIPRWRNASELVSEFKFVVIPRGCESIDRIISENPVLNQYKSHFVIASDIERMDISSTLIRDKVSKGEDFSKYTTKEVVKYIKENYLYNYINTV